MGRKDHFAHYRCLPLLDKDFFHYLIPIFLTRSCSTFLIGIKLLFEKKKAYRVRIQIAALFLFLSEFICIKCLCENVSQICMVQESWSEPEVVVGLSEKLYSTAHHSCFARPLLRTCGFNCAQWNIERI